MEINLTKNENKLDVVLSGRLDTITAPELEKVLNDNPEDNIELTLNMQDVEYVSSAGLRVLLQAYKRLSVNGKFILKGVRDEVMEVLEMTGFTDFLTIE